MKLLRGIKSLIGAAGEDIGVAILRTFMKGTERLDERSKVYTDRGIYVFATGIDQFAARLILHNQRIHQQEPTHRYHLGGTNAFTRLH